MSLYIGNTKVKQVSVVFNDGAAADVNEHNIRKDIRILGIVGTFTADGTQTAGKTLATSDDIVNGKSAWANGEEVQGNLVINNYYVGEDIPSPSLGINGDIYLRK